MAKLIKSSLVDLQKTFVIGNRDLKNENKQAAMSSVSAIKTVLDEGANQDEVEARVKIEKLEQLKIKLQKETDDIKESANSLADDIIEDANMRAKSIVEDAMAKANEILSEKEKEGYKKGYNEAMAKYTEMLQDAKRILDDAEDYRKKSFDNQEKEIVNIILQCVSKIIRQKMSEDDSIVTGVILSSIADLNSRQKLIVKISREDFEETTMIRTKILGMFPGVKDVEIKMVDGYSSGDVEIESNEGTVNPSIKAQFIKLREEFSKLLEGEKE